MRRYDVSIVTSGHDVADARLHREVAALRRAGLTVEVLGLGEASAAPDGVPVRTSVRGGLRRRAARAVVQPWRARGRVLVCLDPDVVPSAMLRRFTRRRIVVDVHEDYLALLEDRRWAQGAAGRLAAVLVRLSTRLASRADLTVVADDHVPPACARNRLVVKNLPDPSMLPEPSPRDATPRALYVGDIRRSRGLFAMLDAIAAAPPWQLDLVGPVATADQAALDQWLASSPAAARVRLHGRLEPRRAWSLARGAWAGLALLEQTPAFEAAVPTKVYEYLACGLPVLVTPVPAMRRIVTEADGGAVVADAEQAAEVLCRWLENTAELDGLSANGVAWTSQRSTTDLAYDALAAKVAAL